MKEVEAVDSDVTPVCDLSLPIACDSHDGGGEKKEGQHATEARSYYADFSLASLPVAAGDESFESLFLSGPLNHID